MSRTIRSVTGAESVTCSFARAVPTASIRSAKTIGVAASALTSGAWRAAALLGAAAAARRGEAARRGMRSCRVTPYSLTPAAPVNAHIWSRVERRFVSKCLK